DGLEGSVIMVTHDELHIRAVATKLIVFDNDTIRVFDGTYDDVLNDVGWSDEDY
ncbi:ABC transporter ATP-binding protein, partial [Leptospira bandrabouensis]|nr:ABC transporter ATP-binding protein [Leptospira bandrabouensis]